MIRLFTNLFPAILSKSNGPKPATTISKAVAHRRKFARFEGSTPLAMEAADASPLGIKVTSLCSTSYEEKTFSFGDVGCV
jgi:hypothetical protein